MIYFMRTSLVTSPVVETTVFSTAQARMMFYWNFYHVNRSSSTPTLVSYKACPPRPPWTPTPAGATSTRSADRPITSGATCKIWSGSTGSTTALGPSSSSSQPTTPTWVSSASTNYIGAHKLTSAVITIIMVNRFKELQQLYPSGDENSFPSCSTHLTRSHGFKPWHRHKFIWLKN